MYTIYVHINKINLKVYIGQTKKKVEERWGKGGKNYLRHTTIFSNAIKKYGWDNFLHVIIKEGLTKEEADCVERYLIAYYKGLGVCYNMTDGGEGIVGIQFTDSRREAISKATKGRIPWNKGKRNIFSKETLENISKKHRGKIVSEETRRKQSLSRRGRKFTEKHKERISRALTGIKRSEEFKEKLRKRILCNTKSVLKYDLGGNLLKKYPSIREATKDTGVKGTHISRCARGKRPTAGGFIWKYA